jgi:hypothetical protein
MEERIKQLEEENRRLKRKNENQRKTIILVEETLTESNNILEENIKKKEKNKKGFEKTLQTEFRKRLKQTRQISKLKITIKGMEFDVKNTVKKILMGKITKEREICSDLIYEDIGKPPLFHYSNPLCKTYMLMVKHIQAYQIFIRKFYKEWDSEWKNLEKQYVYFQIINEFDEKIEKYFTKNVLKIDL